MDIRVKNIKNTTGRKPPAPYQDMTWLDFYEKKHGYGYTYCRCAGCSNRVDVGAHVIKDADADDKWYIVPLCNACNQRTDSFLVDSSVLESIY